MSDIAIKVEDLGKRYTIGATAERYETLRDSIARSINAPVRGIRNRFRSRADGRHHLQQGPPHIWALRHLSFDVRKGQVIGVIGRNGAGKSTLLKILSRVTEPSEGYAEIHGRVGSLLEVGTGFHPELTGRENIYLNGAILGMARSEIDKKFDEIVAFSEVEKFIDTPVKRYSSGMYLRLAFSVAAHLEPEILVVDEVLAVGDAEFQRKCLGKMSNVAEEGRTVLFVSHNMSAILRLTEESLVLDKGSLIMRAPSQKAVEHYLSSGYAQVGERTWAQEEIPPDAYPFTPRLVRVRDHHGRVVDTLRSSEPITIEIEYNLAAPLTGLRVGVYLMTTHGEFVFTSFDTDSSDSYEQHRTRQVGTYRSRCQIPADFLNEGRYVLGINASTYKIRRYFQDEQALTFTIDPTGAPGMQWSEPRLGPVRPRLDWQIETLDRVPVRQQPGTELHGERAG